MPFAQLVTSALERSLNRFLTLDEKTDIRIAKLAGKQIVVALSELDFPLRFCFADQILVLSERETQSNQFDAFIKVSLFSIAELKYSSQLTRLIKEDKLVLEGDLSVAQQFSSLFSELDIDWEELLSQRVGDVLAYHVVKTTHHVKQRVSQLHQSILQMAKDAALEEKRIAAHPLLVEQFVEETHRVKNQVDKLEQRIQKLEQRNG